MAEVMVNRLIGSTDTGHIANNLRDKAASEKDGPAKIGPNAILQLAEVLDSERHDRWRRDIFYRAGLSRMLIEPPTSMVDERAVADLYQALFERLPLAAALRIAGEAGTRTARYILANRIPKPVQAVLKILPRRWSTPLLLRAIERHAWTFAGSGEVRIETGPSMAIEIVANPIAMPGCVWHVAVFEELFRYLIAKETRVEHRSLYRAGLPVCRFEIMLDGGKENIRDG